MGDDLEGLNSHFPKEVLGKTGRENISIICRESPWAPRGGPGLQPTRSLIGTCALPPGASCLPPSTEIRLLIHTHQAWSRDGARTAKREKRVPVG